MCILIHMRLWKIKIFHNWKWSWKGEVIEPLNRLSSLRNKKLAIYLISSYESLWACWADMKYFITAKIILFCPISCCENLFGYQLSFVSIIASHIQYPDSLTCKFRVSLVFMLTNHWVKLLPLITQIRGRIPGGSIAKINYPMYLYLCAKFDAFAINPTIHLKFCTNLLD